MQTKHSGTHVRDPVLVGGSERSAGEDVGIKAGGGGGGPGCGGEGEVAVGGGAEDLGSSVVGRRQPELGRLEAGALDPGHGEGERR